MIEFTTTDGQSSRASGSSSSALGRSQDKTQRKISLSVTISAINNMSFPLPNDSAAAHVMKEMKTTIAHLREDLEILKKSLALAIQSDESLRSEWYSNLIHDASFEEMPIRSDEFQWIVVAARHKKLLKYEHFHYDYGNGAPRDHSEPFESDFKDDSTDDSSDEGSPN